MCLKSFIGLITCMMVWISCTTESANKNYSLEPGAIPAGFPPMFIPSDNGFTKERWTLGKKLFYDPTLSLDGKISCASCHDPKRAFSDSVAVSPGSGNVFGTRNSPSLANIGYHPYFMREGGVPTLEMQVLVPIEEHAEFNHHILKIVEILSGNEEYQRLAKNAYGQELNPFVITRAIANFERTLISATSPFDLYHIHDERDALSHDALEGKKLFFSERTQCSSCHSGFNFTNYSFQNNGLYIHYKDPGRQRLTNQDSDFALFKVPSLRNVAVTAPYMHDGSLKTLHEVIDHYNSGGKMNTQQSPLIKPLGLTDKEKKQLFAFLESLTDTYFIHNNNFRN